MSNGESRDSVLNYLRRVHAAQQDAGVSDAELLRRFAERRDEAAFELLVWRHGAMVLRVCRGVLRDHHAAEDAFQATFLALARKAASVARSRAPAGWLHRVGFRVALRARAGSIRRSGREALQVARASPRPPEAAAEAAELAALLHEEVDRLDARYRTPVVICYLEGRTYEEAARALGWPVGTVSGRLARARELLKRRLLRRGVTLPATGLAALAAGTAEAAPTGPLAAATARAAAGYAAGGAVPPEVSAASSRLAQGVIHAMFLAKLKAAAVVCLVLGLAAVGAGSLVGGRRAGAAPPGPPSAAEAPGASHDAPFAASDEWKQSTNNLKQILLAMHNYHDVHGHFATNITDKQGRRLLSWRVAILSYLEQAVLHDQFKLDEPWDSEHNKKLLAQMPMVYRAPNQPERASKTYYQGFSGPGTMFDPAGPVRISDVTDGTSNTLFVVEAGTPVPWTKPEDITYDPKTPLPTLGGVFPDRIYGGMVDGSVHALRKDFKENAMRAAITRNDRVPPDIEGIHLGRDQASGTRPAAPRAARGEAELWRERNVLVRRLIVTTETLTDSARKELARLRRDASRRKGNETETDTLAAENKALEEEFGRKQAELEKIRDEIARLKRDLDK